MADTRVVVERRIAAPAGPVWEVLTDLDGMPSVLSGVDRVEVLTEGPFTVGTRWRETRRMFGKRATEEMRVTACEPPSRYVVEAHAQGTRYVSEFALSEEGPGSTTVRMTFTATSSGGVTGLLARLLGGIGAKAVARTITKDLADVAATLENPTR
ncbi:SRPBCC family protein [Streptomyces sporangiiformans]|uniref:SRPBCC family protein n=1 Tax=Streptomyces sporangiiformans TaxID=2315329 RepID=UPI001F08A76E|nr:SRPBCC family protein [Streptomyces sporangiiformans]